MGRRVDLRDDVHSLCGSLLDEVAELGLGVGAVDGRKPGIGGALEAEGRVAQRMGGIVDIGGAVVVEVHLKGVHLIIGHYPDELLKVAHRDVFPADIEHEAADGIFGHVDGGAGGDAAAVELRELQDGACGPVEARGGGGGHVDAFADAHGVSLSAGLFVAA